MLSWKQCREDKNKNDARLERHLYLYLEHISDTPKHVYFVDDVACCCLLQLSVACMICG